MPILYRFEEDGSFVAGDTETGFAARLPPTHPQMKRDLSPEGIAFTLMDEADSRDRQGSAPVNEALRENDARFMAMLEAGRADGTTSEISREWYQETFGLSDAAAAALAAMEAEIDWMTADRRAGRGEDVKTSPELAEAQERWTLRDDAKSASKADPDRIATAQDIERNPWNAVYMPVDDTLLPLAHSTAERLANESADHWHRDSFNGDAFALDDAANAEHRLEGRMTEMAAPEQVAPEPLAAALDAVSGPPDVLDQLLQTIGERGGAELIDWPAQPDTYHGQRDARAEAGRPIEPVARLLATLEGPGFAEQGAVVTNYATQERGGLEPGERVFLAPDHPRQGRGL